MSRPAVEMILHWSAVALYIGAVVLIASAVVFQRPERTRLGTLLAALGLLPHGAAIAIRWAASGHGPYMLKYEVLSSDAWLAVLFIVIFLVRRAAWAVLALVGLPAAILAIAVGLFSNPEIRDLPPALRSVWLLYHIGFAKLAAGSFLLSLASGIVQLLARRGGDRSWLRRVPRPEALDANTVRFVGFGFIFWTIAIAAGAIWANQSWGRYWGWDAIETWSLITWLVYGTFLHVRFFFRTSERATAWMAIGCFAIFVLTIAVLPFLLPSLHSAYFQ